MPPEPPRPEVAPPTRKRGTKPEDLKLAQFATRINSTVSATGARAWAIVAPNAPIPLVVPAGLWETLEPQLAVWLGTLNVDMGKWTPWIYGGAMALNFASVAIALAQVRKLSQASQPQNTQQPASQAPPATNAERPGPEPTPEDLQRMLDLSTRPS